MKPFWKREDELEARLRAERPEAPPELTEGLVTRIESNGARPTHTRRRIAVAAAMTIAGLAVFGAFGGLGSASNAVSKATGIDFPGATKKATVPALLEQVTVASSPSQQQYEGEVTICHRTGNPNDPWVVISVDANSLPAHKAHGDTLVNPNPPPECPGPEIILN